LINKPESIDTQVIDFKAMALLVLLCASWGIQQVAIKVALPGISPLFQSGIRSIGATLFVLAWMNMRKIPILEKDGTFRWGMLVGLLFAGEFILIYWGLEYTHASRGIIFLYLSPFVVAIGAQLFIPGEHLVRVQAVGLCCAFTGIVIAFSESLRCPTRQMLIGDSMLTGAALLWGATTVLIKASPLVRIRPAKTLLYQVGVSAVMLPIASMLKNEPGIVMITPLIACSLVYQTLWVASITYLVWFWLIRNYPPSRLASFTFLAPLIGVIAGGLLLNEPLSIRLFFALLFVATGIYLVNRPLNKTR
jgi:drug/metabolite transporter (DMT)-like permease